MSSILASLSPCHSPRVLERVGVCVGGRILCLQIPTHMILGRQGACDEYLLRTKVEHLQPPSPVLNPGGVTTPGSPEHVSQVDKAVEEVK